MATQGISYRICIAEDYTLFREGLKAILSTHPDFVIAGEAGDGLELLALLIGTQADLILLDLCMPRMSGMEVIPRVLERYPEIRILVLSGMDSRQSVQEAMQAGAHGYLLKQNTVEEMILAIRCVLEGRLYLSSVVAGHFLQPYLDGGTIPQENSPLAALTQREKEILKLIAEGYKNRVIAQMLNLSVKTVDTQRGSLMKKLDRHSVAALTAFAMEVGVMGGKWIPETLN